MAEALTLKDNIEVSLAVIADEVEALPERLNDLDGTWRDEWSTNMARFEWLVDLVHEGKLDVGEQAEYERLLRQLREYLPLTKQIGLWVRQKLLDAIKEVS